MRHRTIIAGITAAALLFPGPLLAQSGVSEQCVENFTHIVSAQAIGKKCNWLDAASGQKLQAAQTGALSCVLSGADASEKTDISSTDAPDEVKAAASAVGDMPCDGSARAFFNAQVAGGAK